MSLVLTFYDGEDDIVVDQLLPELANLLLLLQDLRLLSALLLGQVLHILSPLFITDQRTSVYSNYNLPPTLSFSKLSGFLGIWVFWVFWVL